MSVLPPLLPRLLPLRALAILACLFGCFSDARAALIAWDDFEGYPAGSSINDKAGGHGWSNEWSAPSAGVTVVDEAITYALGPISLGGGRALKLAATNENALLRHVPPQLEGRDIYLSFLFQIRGGTEGTSFTGNIFSGWQAQDASSSTGNDSIAAVGAAGAVAARVKNLTTPISHPLLLGRTYLFVAKYTGWQNNTYRSVQVWLNPAPADEASSDSTITRVREVNEDGAGSHGFIGLRVRTVGLNADTCQLIDDLRIGTTWADVVPAATYLPPPPPHSTLVVFGDSLSSGGRSGTPSTGPLPTPDNGGYPRETWIQQISPRAGYGVLFNSYVPGGTNYAIGGDTTVGLVSQVDRFFAATGNIAAPDALYVLWCGPNDISRAIEANIFNAYSAAETAARSARDRMEAQIRRLAAAGGRTFVWPNLPDLSQTPAIGAYGSLGAAVAGPILRNATNVFNNGMSAAINRLRAEFPDIVIHKMDTAAWFADIIANKTAYGFADVSGQSKTDNSFLFYDNVHPTSHGHAALAGRAISFFGASGLLAPIDSLAGWRNNYFNASIPTYLTAEAADPDDDGLPNLLEYALGGHPLDPASPPDPALQVAGIGAPPSNHALTLAFTRIADPALTYRVQASDDLAAPATWTDVWTSTGSDNSAGPITVSDNVTLPTHPRRFLRLAVDRGFPSGAAKLIAP